MWSYHSYIHNQRRSSSGPPISVQENELRVILYTRAVQAVWRQGFTHFIEVESEVSMTAQKVCQVEADLSMLSLNQRAHLFDQHRGPAPCLLYTSRCV